MGVEGFWSIVEPIAVPVKLESLNGERVAVDASIWLYAFMKAMRDPATGEMLPNAHIIGFLRRISKLLFIGVKPVFVFDGSVPELKRRTIRARQERRSGNRKQHEKTHDQLLFAKLKKYAVDAVAGSAGSGTVPLTPNSAKKRPRDDFELPDDSALDDLDTQFDDSFAPLYSLKLEDLLPGEAANLHDNLLDTIDLNSETFKLLPFEIQQEIVAELRARSRQTSWNRLGEFESISHENPLEFSRMQILNTVKRNDLWQRLDRMKTLPGTENGDKVMERRVISSQQNREYILVRNKDSASWTFAAKQEDLHDVYTEVRKPLVPSLSDLVQNLDASSSDEGSSEEELVLNKGKEPMYSKIREEDQVGKRAMHVIQVSSDDDSDVLPPPPFQYVEVPEKIILPTALPTESQLYETSESSAEPPEFEISPKPESSMEPSARDEEPNETRIPLAEHDEDFEEPRSPSPVESSKDEPDKDLVVSPKPEPSIEPPARDEEPNETQTPLAENDEDFEEPRTPSPVESLKDEPDAEDLNELMAPLFEIEHEDEYRVDVNHNLNQENDEYASFISKVQNKKFADVQQELNLEVEALRLQHRAQKRDAAGLTVDMTEDCKQLLTLFGIPFIVAPGEAEAQCAFLKQKGLVDGIITDDSDVFLFGGDRVYKNMFNQSRFVERYTAQDLAQHACLTRDRLIAMAYLVGSDYTAGIPGVGPTTAMEILAEFKEEGLEGLANFFKWVQSVWSDDSASKTTFTVKHVISLRICASYLQRNQAKKWVIQDGFPDARVRDAYLNPAVDESLENFEWGVPDLETIRNYLFQKLTWDKSKVDALLLPLMKLPSPPSRQLTIERFMPVVNRSITFKKSIQEAINRLQGASAPKAISRLAEKDSSGSSSSSSSEEEIAPKRRSKAIRGKTRGRRGGNKLKSLKTLVSEASNSTTKIRNRVKKK